MPAAIATVPSNGPVATNTPTTPSAGLTDSGFLQVLRDLGTETSATATPEAGTAIPSGQTAEGAADGVRPSVGPDWTQAANAAPGTDSSAQQPNVVSTPAAAEAGHDDGDGTTTVARKGNRTGKTTDPAAVDQLAASLAQVTETAPGPVVMPASELLTNEQSSPQTDIPDGETGPSGTAALTASLNGADGIARTDAGQDASGTPPPAQAAAFVDTPAGPGPCDRTARTESTSPKFLSPASAESPTFSHQSETASAASGHKTPLHLVALDGTAAAATPSPGLAAAPSAVLATQPTETSAPALAGSAPATETTAAAPTPATPAAQIAPALLALGHAADGSQQMTLRLHPADLGTVQVQIGRTETGSARVEITAEKADTLQTLMRDQPQLHRALDDAGVPAAGRTITFHATQPASAAAGGNGSSSWTSSQSGTGGASSNNPSGGGKSGYTGSEPGGGSGARRQGQPSGEKAGSRGSAFYRVGLNIIA